MGGWGGRLVQSDSVPTRWEDGPQAADYNPFREELDHTFTQTRWVPAIQSDFAARADWCVLPYSEANHAPEVTLEHPETLVVLHGEVLSLKGNASDPDGDVLEYRWWQYWEVDSYQGELSLGGAKQPELQLQVPEEIKSGESLHLILEVTDQAEHPMPRYKRVILTAR